VGGGIVLSSVLGQLTLNQGVGSCRSWEGGLYLTSEVVLTGLAGIALLGDPVGWRFLTGGVLILGSAVAIQMLPARRRRDPSPEMDSRSVA
jgi:drug/metabolite transporter (DMT)-like permease